jgi:fibronectin type 3 domain-containing protein
MPWIDDEEPIAPILKISNVRDGNKTLQWSISNPQNESLQFAVYRFALNEKIYIHSSKNLIAIVRGNSFVEQLNDGKQYKYVVTALDRLHNESQLSNSVQQ